MRERIDRCAAMAKASGKLSLAIVGSTANRNNPPFAIGPTKESDRFVGSSFITRDLEVFKEICTYADGKVDYLFVDVEAKTDPPFDFLAEAKACVKTSKVKTYKGNDITAHACDLLVSEIVGDLAGKKVAIIGAGNIGSKVAVKLVERGADVYINRRDRNGDLLASAINAMKTRYTSGTVYSASDPAEAARHADVLIGFTQGIPAITGAMISALNSNALIVDGGVGTLTEDAIAAAKSAGLSLFRLDVRIALPFVVDSILSTERFLTSVAGTFVDNGKTYVAGGIIGSRGDIVVETIADLGTIVGIADGKGGILKYR
ncbi:NAD(P)-dependent oxidoreductase [Paenibacillus sp.]|uniref:NAD(P)-dependent oxidoreductase n=1 Tax=Paenibacillus sp. TaxID=58172 RepID=UPI002810BD9E|nr:NAD(P)-binding domain-containing protein [Paenibacillus sp.]